MILEIEMRFAPVGIGKEAEDEQGGLAEIAQQLHAAGNKVGNGNKSNK